MSDRKPFHSFPIVVLDDNVYKDAEISSDITNQAIILPQHLEQMLAVMHNNNNNKKKLFKLILIFPLSGFIMNKLLFAISKKSESMIVTFLSIFLSYVTSKEDEN